LLHAVNNITKMVAAITIFMNFIIPFF